jgi:hypothetical protein
VQLPVQGKRFEDVPGCYRVGSGVLRSGVVVRRVLVWVPVGGPMRRFSGEAAQKSLDLVNFTG